MAGEEKFAPISEQFVLETLVREKRRVRKLAIAILLIICLLYFVSCMFSFSHVHSPGAHLIISPVLCSGMLLSTVHFRG